MSRLKLNSKATNGFANGNHTTQRLSSLIKDSHIKTREASQQTSLDMREFLGIYKPLQSIQGELVNNISNLAEINKRNERETKKIEEVKNYPTYTD